MAEKYTSVEALASYAIGRQVGEQLTGQPFPGLVPEALLDGLSGVLKGETCPYKDADLRAALDELNRRVMKMQQQQASASAAMGEQFLKENAQKPGIVTTASGLQYEVMKEGKGPKPGPDASVRVHYHGTLVDGTVFDSSVQRGEPIEFPVNGVIAGWTEALQLMPQGSKWKLYIPQDLAYGARGAGGVIGPYATLIFEVDLLRVL
ncbi:MAG TPA: FKBP-type peptidyl-prolyl cis-trans isomerase [Pseudomonadales bacterium]